MLKEPSRMLTVWVLYWEIEYASSVELYPTKEEANRVIVDWIMNDSGEWDEERFLEDFGSDNFNLKNLDALNVQSIIDWFLADEPRNVFELFRMEIDPFEYINKQNRA